MTKSTYLAHLTTGHEPPEAAAIRQQAATVKAAAADKAAAERQAAKYLVYELTGKWWRMVRG